MEVIDKPKSIRLIIHPGHDKCGSSFIQSFIYSNLDKLKEVGIYVSDKNFRFLFEAKPRKSSFIWEQPLSYFSDIIYATQDTSLFEERLKNVLEAGKNSDCQAILISSETLKNIEEATCQKIHKILAQYFDNVTVIYYIRRQDDYIVSSWQQWRHKLGISLNDYINECLASGNPHFWETAKFFEDIYGVDSLKVRFLASEALIEKNLAKDFCYHSKIDIKDATCFNCDYDTNPNLNPHICDLLARIHTIYDFTNLNQEISVIHNQRIKEMLSHYVESKDILCSNDKSILTQEAQAVILKYFENENREICKRYLKDTSYEDYFSQRDTGKSQERLEYEIDKLKDVMAIQMEVIIKLLLLEKEEKNQNKLKTKIQQIWNKLFGIMRCLT